jgi:hypothetical protein
VEVRGEKRKKVKVKVERIYQDRRRVPQTFCFFFLGQMECEGFIQTFLIGLFRGSCQGFDWMGSWGLSTSRVDDLPKVRFRFQVREGKGKYSEYPKYPPNKRPIKWR